MLWYNSVGEFCSGLGHVWRGVCECCNYMAVSHMYSDHRTNDGHYHHGPTQHQLGEEVMDQNLNIISWRLSVDISSPTVVLRSYKRIQTNIDRYRQMQTHSTTVRLFCGSLFNFPLYPNPLFERYWTPIFTRLWRNSVRREYIRRRHVCWWTVRKESELRSNYHSWQSAHL